MARYLSGELRRLRTEWPQLVKSAPEPPTFSWEDLKEALLQDVDSPLVETAVRGGLAALLKMAEFKPPELVFREILVLASSALDPDFATTVADKGEAPMP